MRPNLSTWQALAVATQFGFTLAVAVGLGILVGSYLDDRLGTSFIFTLVGVLVGFAAALLSTIQLLSFVQRRQARRDEDGQGD